MSARFTILASGSRGNASLLEIDDFGLLIDIGLGPRQLAVRMAEIGSSWHSVHAAILTHTHRDHWNDRTLTYLSRRRIPLYCHRDHERQLRGSSLGFGELRAADLVRTYKDLVIGFGVCCRPIPVRHDGGATFAFRFDSTGTLFSPRWALAYVADLGSWDEELAEAITGVDLLALEFNHDTRMEQASGRGPGLIARILGGAGHLSNDQAAGLLREVIRRSGPGRLRQLVQLHVSRQCNRPDVAIEAVHRVLDELRVALRVHTACQHTPSPTFLVLRSNHCG